MRYILLYVPALLSWAFQDSPQASYGIAWAGSWIILWQTLSGNIEPLPEGKPWYQQILRPLFLPQMIFAGYMALSSIFYFLWVSGQLFESNPPGFDINTALQYSAAAQRYYILGHTALAHAIVWRMQYKPGKISFKTNNLPNTLLKITLVFVSSGILVSQVPGLDQFSVKFDALSFVTATLLLAVSITERKVYLIAASGSLFIYNLYQALLSGWKEAVLIPVILLSAYLFPRYKRVMTAIVAPIVFLGAFILPAFVETVRHLSWRGGLKAEEAATIAYRSIASADAADWQKSNQAFLTSRVSEIGMFNKYLNQVPDHREFYNTKIINQGLLNLVPRFFYPEKPETEKLVMERVYENGIIEYYSTNVSAKPQLAIDGYLSFGALGVWLFCFAMGWASAFASVEAERLFGGYIWGTCVIYTGLFQEFWRGNCFEFLLNTTVWSFVLMYILYFTGRAFKFIVPVQH